MNNIPITKPFFTGEESSQMQQVLDSGWVTQGPMVARFEQAFRDFSKSAHALAVTSCTTALHLALKALGIQEGDEVIVPSFTFTASANVVEHCGARPVFADIDLATFNIDPRGIEALITPRTKALMPVHLFGLAADMDPILALAEKYALSVVEDAACGFDAWYKNRHVGTFGDVGCFSFHPRKAITTGEGGMVITENEKLAERIRSLRDHGAMTSDLQRHLGNRPYVMPEIVEPGYNYRMTDIQAALGVSQMNNAKEIQHRRRDVAGRYDDALRGNPWLVTPVCPQGYIHGCQSYVCLFAPERITLQNVEKIHAGRNAFMDHLQARGIATRPGTQAVHILEYYRKTYGIQPEDLPNSLMAYMCSVTLPLYAHMSDDEFGYVMNTLQEFDPSCAA